MKGKKKSCHRRKEKFTPPRAVRKKTSGQEENNPIAVN
jgi:hypothetical protein